ncbi:MAG: hypothetical protein QXK89_09810 [Candidatus Bathyarchaeia archaeon]
MPVQRFRMTTTSKGALFRAKRWFYSTFYTKASSEVKEDNRRAWVELAGKIIEEINRHNAADKPTRLTINYEVGPRGEFKPTSVTVELMEIRPLESFTVTMSAKD